jgi:Fe-S cluster assembly protein SufD
MKAPVLDSELLRHAVDTRPGPDWLARFRRESLERFLDAGFPTVRQEAWKYTNLSPVAELTERWLSAKPTPEDETGRPAAALAEDIVGGGSDAHTVLFVDGRLDTGSLPRDLPDGVSLEPLLEADVPPIGAVRGDAMTALNGALLTDGLRLTLADSASLDRPLYLLLLVTGETEAVVSPRILIEAGRGANATIVEHYAGEPDARRFTNVVTDIVQDTAARLQHYRFQQQPSASFQVSRLHARLAASAELDCHSIDLGGQLVRHDAMIRLTGDGARVALNGIYVTDGRQHVDNHTRVDHEAPDTISREDYRGVLKDSSRAVFNGKVMVHAGADGTDAAQSNRNLLLSEGAEVDTKPELEIYADDVKCSHGATVGQLDQTSLFYLRSRGLDEETARHLLTFAFLREIVGRARNAALGRRMERMLVGGLPEFEELESLL